MGTLPSCDAATAANGGLRSQKLSKGVSAMSGGMDCNKGIYEEF